MILDRPRFLFSGYLPTDFYQTTEMFFNNIFHQVLFYDFEKNETLRIRCDDGLTPVGKTTISGGHAKWSKFDVEFLRIQATAYTDKYVIELDPTALEDWLCRETIVLTSVGHMDAHMVQIDKMEVIYDTVGFSGLGDRQFTHRLLPSVFAPRGGKGLDFVVFCSFTKKTTDVDVLGLTFGRPDEGKTNDLRLLNPKNKCDRYVYTKDGRKQKMKIVCWKPDEIVIGSNTSPDDGSIIRYLLDDGIVLKKINAVIDLGVGVKVEKIIVRNHNRTLFELGKVD